MSQPQTGIVLIFGTVSLRLDSFSMNYIGVQFIPSMSRTRKATHRTRLRNGFCPGFFETLTPKNLSVNYINLQRHLAKRDDGGCEVVECNEAPFELFVANQ